MCLLRSEMKTKLLKKRITNDIFIIIYLYINRISTKDVSLTISMNIAVKSVKTNKYTKNVCDGNTARESLQLR